MQQKHMKTRIHDLEKQKNKLEKSINKSVCDLLLLTIATSETEDVSIWLHDIAEIRPEENRTQLTDEHQQQLNDLIRCVSRQLDVLRKAKHLEQLESGEHVEVVEFKNNDVQWLFRPTKTLFEVLRQIRKAL